MRTLPFPSADEREKRLIFDTQNQNQEGVPTSANPEARPNASNQSSQEENIQNRASELSGQAAASSAETIKQIADSMEIPVSLLNSALSVQRELLAIGDGKTINSKLVNDQTVFGKLDDVFYYKLSQVGWEWKFMPLPLLHFLKIAPSNTAQSINSPAAPTSEQVEIQSPNGAKPEQIPQSHERGSTASNTIETIAQATDLANQADAESASARIVLAKPQPKSFLDTLFSPEFWKNLGSIFGWTSVKATEASLNAVQTIVSHEEDPEHEHTDNCGCNQEVHRPRRNPCGPKMGIELLAKYDLEQSVTVDNFTAGLETLTPEQLENAIFQVRNDIYNKTDEYQAINRRWNRTYSAHQRATRPVNTAAFQHWPARRVVRGNRIPRYDFMAGKRAETNAVRDKYGALEKLYWGLIHEWGKRKASGEGGSRNGMITRRQSQQLWRGHVGKLRNEEGNRDGDSVRARVLKRQKTEMEMYDQSGEIVRRAKAREEENSFKMASYRARTEGLPSNWTGQQREAFMNQHPEVYTPAAGDRVQSTYNDTTGSDAQDAHRRETIQNDRILNEAAQNVRSALQTVANTYNISFRVSTPSQTGEDRLIQLVPATGSAVARSSIRIRTAEEGGLLYDVIDYKTEGTPYRADNGKRIPRGTVTTYRSIEDAVNAITTMTNP
jgi:hypothetical protein